MEERRRRRWRRGSGFDKRGPGGESGLIHDHKEQEDSDDRKVGWMAQAEYGYLVEETGCPKGMEEGGRGEGQREEGEGGSGSPPGLRSRLHTRASRNFEEERERERNNAW